MIVWLTGTIHREVESINYAAKFSAEVYETMSAHVKRNLWLISYTIVNIQYARMFDSKCIRMHMNMLWWYDHDYSYKRMHNCIWMKEEYMRSFHLEAVIWILSSEGS